MSLLWESNLQNLMRASAGLNDFVRRAASGQTGLSPIPVARVNRTGALT